MYLVLKELLPLAEDVIIVISCLTKDMNSKIDLYKANAIRVLCKINDVRLKNYLWLSCEFTSSAGVHVSANRKISQTGHRG